MLTTYIGMSLFVVFVVGSAIVPDKHENKWFSNSNPQLREIQNA
jgi:hypothetical protein